MVMENLSCNKNSASTQLRRWIRQNENLRNQLYELGYKRRKKS
jgi:hypothetical protein